MKKQILFFGALGLILLSACKEVGPPISFAFGTFDKTYTTTPESSEPRRVFVEEATGVKCPNCPAGATLLKQAETNNPGRIIVVGLHANNLASPIQGESKHDFRTQFAADLFTFFGGEPNKPAAVFDRTRQSADNKFFIDNRNLWNGIINQRLGQPSPVKIAVESSLDELTGEATIFVKIAYTEEVSKKQALTVLITEDSIIDAQYEGVNHLPEYEHNHVLRDLLTSVTGISIPTDENIKKTPGRVYEKTFIYKIPPAKSDAEKWNLDKCNVIAFVHNTEADDKEVAQAAEVHLK